MSLGALLFPWGFMISQLHVWFRIAHLSVATTNLSNEWQQVTGATLSPSSRPCLRFSNHALAKGAYSKENTKRIASCFADYFGVHACADDEVMRPSSIGHIRQFFLLKNAARDSDHPQLTYILIV